MNLARIADSLLRIPGVEWGFIQQTEKLENYRAVPVSGSPGQWHEGHRRSGTFRVVLRYKEKYAETSEPHLATAITAALIKLEIDLPVKVAELQKAHAQTEASGPREGRNDREREDHVRQWRATLDAYAATIEQLGGLITWLATHEPAPQAAAA
jgi:aminoglycoside phosphotransferase (APT) family kinase protein